MWRIRESAIGPEIRQWHLRRNSGGGLAFEEVIRGWQSSESFRVFWQERLRDVPFEAHCWECPPLTAATLTRPFECVYMSSPELARMTPDPEAFAEHFRADCSVVSFGNLGGDALLVAPCPEEGDGNFAHLASFTATASQARQDALWQAVGKALEKRIGSEPTWLSAAGLGVAWLHVRLDTRPKYYR
ncbi:MAG: DUF6940 family protein, partial [Steroidobacteraceae bacterium]